MITVESRTDAAIVRGAIIWFVQDGDSYGADGKTASKTNIPAMEEAIAVGKCLGEVKTWGWGAEYKTLAKEGVNPETQRYETREYKTLDKLKPKFSTMDVTPEAYALEHGLESLPDINETARPFTNASGSLRGWLYIQELDSFRTHGEDGEIAQLYLRGDLSLADAAEHTSDLDTVNYEFAVTSFPADGFKNINIPTSL